jgi:uncharacterized protein YkwD
VNTRDGPTRCVLGRTRGRHPSGGLLARAALIAGAGLAVAVVPVAGLAQPTGSPDDAGRNVVWLQSRATVSRFVPDAEDLLLSLVNRERAAHGLAAVTMDAALRNVARQHSRAMALRGFVGHGSPLGDSFLERVSTVVRPPTVVGENVAMAQTAVQAHSAFLASSEHDRNLIDPEFHSAGIGVATAGVLGVAVTELFAR